LAIRDQADSLNFLSWNTRLSFPIGISGAHMKHIAVSYPLKLLIKISKLEALDSSTNYLVD